MREILFRGKRLDSGEWADGHLLSFTDGQINPNRSFILQTVCGVGFADGRFGFTGFVEVDPATAGQYTGLTDRAGRKIFEGDIIQTPKYGVDNGRGQNYSGKDKFVVGYSDGTYTLTNGQRRFCLRPDDAVEVIGNRWDNPELLEEASHD